MGGDILITGSLLLTGLALIYMAVYGVVLIKTSECTPKEIEMGTARMWIGISFLCGVAILYFRADISEGIFQMAESHADGSDTSTTASTMILLATQKAIAGMIFFVPVFYFMFWQVIHPLEKCERVGEAGSSWSQARNGLAQLEQIGVYAAFALILCMVRAYQKYHQVHRIHKQGTYKEAESTADALWRRATLKEPDDDTGYGSRNVREAWAEKQWRQQGSRTSELTEENIRYLQNAPQRRWPAAQPGRPTSPVGAEPVNNPQNAGAGAPPVAEARAQQSSAGQWSPANSPNTDSGRGESDGRDRTESFTSASSRPDK